MLRNIWTLLLVSAFCFSSSGKQIFECYTHVVQANETLYRLSVKYKIKVSEILAANSEIGKSLTIHTGQRICIPRYVTSASPTAKTKVEEIETPKASPAITNPIKEGNSYVHIVQKGESFYNICKQYDILAYDLISANNLSNTIVTENQKLILPATALIKGLNENEPRHKISPIVEMTEIESKNNLAQTNSIQTSDVSKMGVHKVSIGDTYYNITQRYGMNPEELKNLNNLSNSVIRLDQELKIINRKAPEQAKEESEKIPEQAVVIDIAKEVAKREKEKETDVTQTVTTKKEMKKTKGIKEKGKQDEEQARLDLIETAKTQEKTQTSSTKAEDFTLETKETTIENNAEKPLLKKEKNIETALAEPPKKSETITEPTPIKEELPATAQKEMEADVEIKKEILKPKPVLSFSEEYADEFLKKSGNQNLKITKQRGLAETSDKIVGNEYLAFCNSCAPGTVVKITNLMSKRSVYVKVLGKSQGNSMLTVSSKLATQLDILGNDFLVEVSTFTKN